MSLVIDRIAEQRVIPVIRAPDPDDAVETARACARAGMSVIELTRSVPEVELALRELADGGLTLGVGTITEPGEIESASAAGADFVVSFVGPEDFCARAAALRLTAIPGGFTPTELAAGAAAGAELVKLFPARLATPGYLRDLRAVMPDLKVMPTGGIGGGDGGIADWLAAGAVAVGIGSEIGTAGTVGVEEVERRCRDALESSRIDLRSISRRS